MGVRRVVATGADQHGETEAVLRLVRRLYVNRDNLRRAITRLVNATFAVRDTGLWGEGTACASDSKKFGSWQSNLMTEWHNRYGGAGGDDLLARRAAVGVHLQPTAKLFGQ
jgi:TnpA family transposase